MSGSLIAEITGTVDDDPWAPDAMTWPLLETSDASLDEPGCRIRARHLGHFHTGDEAELRQGRRYSVARRLAGLSASYVSTQRARPKRFERDPRQVPLAIGGWPLQPFGFAASNVEGRFRYCGSIPPAPAGRVIHGRRRVPLEWRVNG